jgi:hypothetical protein
MDYLSIEADVYRVQKSSTPVGSLVSIFLSLPFFISERNNQLKYGYMQFLLYALNSSDLQIGHGIIT